MTLPVYNLPTCTRDAFVAHITGEHRDGAVVLGPSAAAADAPAMWELIGEAGIDPSFVAGMFHVESKCGRLGRALDTLSVGNIRWRDVYAARGYRDVDGFVGYPSFTEGARHVVDHLRGLDGTDFYAGKRDTFAIVSTWAPNDPTRYAAAVESIMRELAPAPADGGGHRVLLIPGHVNIESLTADGLRSWRDWRTLQRGTGAAGERELNADVAARLQRALMNRGVDTFVTDATYDAGVYGQRWDLCLALHAHRDPGEHGRVAIPDVADPPFITAAARDRSATYAQLFVQLWPELAGIAVDPADQGTIGMRQLYTWDYVPEDAAAVIVEMLHLADDVVDPARLSTALATITTRWLGLADPPAPAPSPADQLIAQLDAILSSAQQAARLARTLLGRG